MTKNWLNMATSLSRIDFNLFRPSFLMQGKFTTLSKISFGNRFVIRLLPLRAMQSHLTLQCSSIMKWWSKCISMVIAKTASRNVAFKAARLGDSIFDRQSEILRTEAAQVNSPSHEEDFDDVGCNADLYASRQDAFQGSSRGSDERSQQQNDPHCFQSLSLD